MKKILNFIFLVLLYGNAQAESHITLECGGNIITVGKKYIYQYFGNGDVDKYKITGVGIRFYNGKESSYVSGFLKGNSGFNYDVFLDIDGKTFTVNKKDRKTGIVASYTKDCV